MNNHSNVHIKTCYYEKSIADMPSTVFEGAIHIIGGMAMKKKFKLEDLDCANCAAKMEEAIKEIPGVVSASVNFLAQKLMIEAADEEFDDIVKKAAECISRVEPDCKIIL
jgi:copper chaperone CopZ